MQKLVWKRGGWAGAVLLLAIGVAGLWAMRATYEISLTQQEIQSRIDAKLGQELPVKGPAQAIVRSLRVKAAQLVLAGGSATIDLDIEGALRNGKSFEIAASTQGAPTYSDGAIYFTPTKIDTTKITYEGASVSELAGRLSDRLPIGEKARQLVEDKAHQADGWAQAAAEAAMRRFLEERPVYRLKDDTTKGAALKAALEKIDVEDGRIVATFSLWRLTTTVVAGAFSLLLGIAIVILILRGMLRGEGLWELDP